ncbi:MAG: IS21 family transposase [Planctomycetes bacterium]|nr:IS21 family transposase [Planctomycetota bacterium]
MKIRWIARELKISRSKVRQVFRGEEPPPQEKKRLSLLDPFKNQIQELLKEKGITKKLILKKLKANGYTGGRTILEDYLRSLPGSNGAPRAFARFETLPAEEGQSDWSTYTVEIAGKPTTIQLFSLILCWSRFQYFRAFPDQKLSSLLYGLVAAFRYMAGVVWKIVFDNQKTITPFWIEGKPVINDKFAEFAAHYGFKVHVCFPGAKERKGKVEKPFDYFERNFLPTRKFESLEDFNRQLLDWLDGIYDPKEGNHRIHGTTNEVPYQRWLEEKRYLYELPATELLPRRIEERQVAKDCTLSVLGTLYTVPPRLAGKRVWVSIGDEDLLVYDEKGEMAAKHTLSAQKGGLVIDERHYQEIRRHQHGMPLPEIERQFLERFPDSKDFLNALKLTLRSVAPIHLREILSLERRYRREEIAMALKIALWEGTPTAGHLQKVLSRRNPHGELGELRQELPKGLRLGPVDCGDSDGYEGIFATT